MVKKYQNKLNTIYFYIGLEIGVGIQAYVFTILTCMILMML